MNVGKKHNQSGNLILELAIVLPMFVLISMVGIEMSRSLKFSQAAVTLSREAALNGVRKCGDFWNRPANTAEAIDCLNGERNRLQNLARAAFPGTEIFITIYTLDGAALPVSCAVPPTAASVRTVGTTAAVAGGSYASRINLGNATSNELRRSLCLSRTAVVSEVFIPYQSITGNAGILFTFNPTEFYSATTI
jgi:hypothetical protein